MTKKATGLAAFTRPKTNGTDAESPVTEHPPGASRKRGVGEVVALTVKVRRSDWQRLRQLADAEGTTIQSMAEVGLSAVLAQHGLPPLETHRA